MMAHLKYLAVGGAMVGAMLGVVYLLATIPPSVLAVCALAFLAYGLGWSYYYHRSGQ